MQIRKAVASDAAAIRLLIYRTALNPLELRWKRFLVAVDDRNRVIGCGQIKQHGAVRELASIAVAPAWRKQGIGRALVTHLLDSAELPLYLMTTARRESFYLPFGFRSITADEMPPYFLRIQRLFDLFRRAIPAARALRVMKKDLPAG
jgi:N-acetylglutamate synthase-like GNAT family acetyltransferase